MNVSLKNIVLVLFFAGLAVFVSRFGVSRLYAQDGSAMEYKNNLQRVNEKAKGARSGDVNQLSELADEVFLGSVLDRTPVGTSIKEHVLKAERLYREGKHEPIHEKNIVELVNHLAQSLNAPDYARTSASQVRLLRLALITQTPALVGADAINSSDSVSGSMSPLEAAFVALTLMNQKMHNPAFQVAPSEWDEKRYEAALEDWKSFKAGNSRTLSRASTSFQTHRQSEKSSEMNSFVKRSVREKSDEELNKLLRSSISVFGLAPTEVK
jgi:hypothetical protein